jgi:hypothetical protein
MWLKKEMVMTSVRTVEECGKIVTLPPLYRPRIPDLVYDDDDGLDHCGVGT